MVFPIVSLDFRHSSSQHTSGWEQGGGRLGICGASDEGGATSGDDAVVVVMVTDCYVLDRLEYFNLDVSDNLVEFSNFQNEPNASNLLRTVPNSTHIPVQ